MTPAPAATPGVEETTQAPSIHVYSEQNDLLPVSATTQLGWKLHGSLDDAFKHAGDATVLAVVRTPAQTLGAALAGGASPQQVLSDWCKATDDLLSVARPARRQVVFVDALALQQGSARVWTYLRKELGADVLAAPDAYPAKENKAVSTSPILEILGAVLLKADHKAERLGSLLEAMTVSDDRTQDLDEKTIANALEEVLSTTRKLASAAQTEQENALLQTSLKQMLEETLLLARKSEDLEKVVAEQQLLKATNEAYVHRLDEQKETQRSREAIFGNVLIRDASERASLLQTHQAEIERLQRKVSELESELDALHQSRSWKVTKPLRSTRQRLK